MTLVLIVLELGKGFLLACDICRRRAEAVVLRLEQEIGRLALVWQLLG